MFGILALPTIDWTFAFQRLCFTLSPLKLCKVITLLCAFDAAAATLVQLATHFKWRLQDLSMATSNNDKVTVTWTLSISSVQLPWIRRCCCLEAKSETSGSGQLIEQQFRARGSIRSPAKWSFLSAQTDHRPPVTLQKTSGNYDKYTTEKWLTKRRSSGRTAWLWRR